MEKIIQVLTLILNWAAEQLKSGESKEGIKETKECLVAINEVGLVVAHLVKDGLQAEDAIGFYNEIIANDKMKAVIAAAYENYQAIPKEILDIDLGEGCELAKCQVEYLPKYLAEIKK